MSAADQPSRRAMLVAGMTGLAGAALAACSTGSGNQAATASGSTGATGPTGALGSTGSVAGSGSGSVASTGGSAAGASESASAGASAGSTGAATAAQIAGRTDVPVLCYHQLRDWKAGDSAYNKRFLLCPPANFRAHLDALAAGGYTTITLQQYYDHMTTGAALPEKPVLLSFDDGKDSQYGVGFTELERRKMTGTFFPMTIVLDKDGWLSTKNVKAMADGGMSIGTHTWDHHPTPGYKGTDWETQLVKPREQLSKITGQEILDFAYPYGAWKADVLPHVTAAGYRTAYQLSDKPMDMAHPLLTIRRILIDSTWTGPQLISSMTKQIGNRKAATGA